MINDLLGKNIAGKYRIDSLIRETELGDFYRGTNTATGVPVTVKILAPAMAIDVRYVDRFLAEANALAGVSHRNILNSIDVGTDAQGLPFAIYEALDGETLEDSLRVYGPMEEPRAIGLAKQIASGLTAAHFSELVHGGLNPTKVIISTIDGVDLAKIYDFGIRGHARNSMSAVPYLAPEQSVDSTKTDQRSDIYSLGILLYAMIAGEPPFTGATPTAIIQKAKNEPPAPLSAFRQDLHPQIEPIILSAIGPDPDRRYQKAADLEEDLGRLATETGAELPPANVVVAAAAAASDGRKRSVWQTAFIVLAGIIVLAGGLIYATYTRQTDPTTTAQADANSSPVQPINPATGAQEEAMLKMGDLNDPLLYPNSANGLPADTLPGGDGYNAWLNGGAPPAGAPLNSGSSNGLPLTTGTPMPQYVPPPGQTMTVNPNGGSVFMPMDNGVILVPIPADAVPVKPTPTPKNPAANTTVKPTPDPKATPAANPGGTKVETVKPGTKPVKNPAPAKSPKTTNGPAADMPPSR